MEVSGYEDTARAQGRRTHAGFTLIEVVVALGILAFGLLGVAAMQLYSLRQGQVGKHTTQAALVAQDRVEELMSLDFSGAELSATTGWQNHGTETKKIDTSSGTREEEVYTVDERITDVVAGFTKNIDVRVSWADRDDPNRSLVISTLRYNY
jgi:type IV pilus modification protein PilV